MRIIIHSGLLWSPLIHGNLQMVDGFDLGLRVRKASATAAFQVSRAETSISILDIKYSVLNIGY